jgi:hypothetical protein
VAKKSGSKTSNIYVSEMGDTTFILNRIMFRYLQSQFNYLHFSLVFHWMYVNGFDQNLEIVTKHELKSPSKVVY